MMLEGEVIIVVKIIRNVGGKGIQVTGGGTGFHRHKDASFVVSQMLCLYQ